MDFDIQIIRIGALETFIQSDLYRQSDVVPITPARAVSHARNPRANPEDVALLLAVSDGQILGYLGAIAEEIHTIKGLCRAGWCSCLWVSPKLRGKGMATRLLKEMTEHWGGFSILTEFAPDTRRMYERSGLFTESEAVQGFRGYVRFNLADLLPPKHAFFDKIKPVLRLTDRILNVFNQMRLSFSEKKSAPAFRYLTCLDDRLNDFIGQWNQNELSKRSVSEINWLLQFPWIIRSAQPDTVSKRYHFSMLALDFKPVALEMFNQEGRTTAVVVLSQREQHLRLVAAWFSPDDVAQVAQLIALQMQAMKTAMFTCYNPHLTACFKHQKSPFFAVKPMCRTCMVSQELMALLPEGPLCFQDGDGDVGFT